MADKIVAFICKHNACRSQIAEALAKHAGYKGYAFYSAGSVPQKQIDPNAVRIMKETLGIDMSGAVFKDGPRHSDFGHCYFHAMWRDLS